MIDELECLKAMIQIKRNFLQKKLSDPAQVRNYAWIDARVVSFNEILKMIEEIDADLDTFEDPTKP